MGQSFGKSYRRRSAAEDSDQFGLANDVPFDRLSDLVGAGTGFEVER
jgi:hypothetical protein